MDIDLKQISELLAVVGDNDITELTIESGDQKITVKKSGLPASLVMASDAAQSVTVARPALPQTMSFEPKNEAKAEQKLEAAAPSPDFVPVTSPMVGTFYRSSSPTAKPFVDIGDKVTVGQTVCIIEAMKLMNDMPSEVAGKIVKICVDNGSTVEYGQPLFLVDPKG